MRHLVSLVKMCTECDSPVARPQFYIHLPRPHEYSVLLSVGGYTVGARREYWHAVVVPDYRIRQYPCLIDAFGCPNMFDIPPPLGKSEIEEEIVASDEKYERGFLKYGYTVKLYRTPAFVALVFSESSALSGHFGPRHIVILPPRYYYLLKAVDVKKLEELEVVQ